MKPMKNAEMARVVGWALADKYTGQLATAAFGGMPKLYRTRRELLEAGVNRLTHRIVHVIIRELGA